MDSRDREILHIETILRYCKGIDSLAGFEADPMRADATVFNLMQLGELAKERLSEEAKEKLSAIPWQQIYGMRNRIVHGYSGVSMQIVWDTVSEDLPALLKAFRTLL
ncbi:MAG: DUF86 domain-containing protein [Oscillospiraceae bacterium]|nr:DUF86 domain-containing protein [Oscillospiraceae bacterium]